MSTTTLPPSAEAMPVALLAWKPVEKGALRGFGKLRLGRSLAAVLAAIRAEYPDALLDTSP